MKTLLILRHAKSSWAAPGLADHDRPLNDRGKRDAPRMGQLLLDENLTPDLILSSTAKRARKSAALVAKSCGYSRNVDALADLYLAGPQAYFHALQGVDDGLDRILVVGHNPGMEDLVQELVGEFHRMPTAALAHVELEIDSWVNVSRHVNCRLQNFWCPKELE